MIFLGVVLLLTGFGLIWFRTPITGTRVGDGDIPFSIYIVDQSGQTTLLWIGGLTALLGIGVIVAAIVRPKAAATVASTDRANPSPSRSNDDTPTPPEPIYCANCKTDVLPDEDSRCPSCEWPT